jgi:hypothetical protein
MRTTRLLALAFSLVACGPEDNGAIVRDLSGGPTDLSVPGDLAMCVNLQCKQQACMGSPPTRLTGTILAPSGGDPIPGVVVYVPNAQVAPFPAGVQCETCGGTLSGSPLVQATTETNGKFTLENVPVGDDIPLVIQSGRWRRQVKIPTVSACTENTLPAELGRLPRNQGEGDLPKMALVTGDNDPLECTIAKIVDPAELTDPTGNGRVHLYKQNGNDYATTLPTRATLVGDLAKLKQYDAVLLPCPGHAAYSQPEADNLKSYADQGGRVFTTHGGGYWMLEPTSQYGAAIAFNNQPDPGNSVAYLDTSFPKGMTFSAWLQLIGVSTTAGEMPISGVQWFVDSVQPPAQRWVYTQGPTTVQHLTFNTPIGASESQQCGRVLFSNFHVGSSTGVGLYPATCVAGALSSNEKIIEFMLFDVTACVRPDVL